MSLNQQVLSSLDIEAAHYFKLDSSQVHLLGPPIRSHKKRRPTGAAKSKTNDEANKITARKRRNRSPGSTRSHSGFSGSRACLAHLPARAESSSNSSNSLPSISSSPSVSPSLVCPHLSLDDILDRRGVSKSPHTVGLCAKCRLNPPPNVQSPLSPIYMAQSMAPAVLRRGYSDYQTQLRSKPAGLDQRPSQMTASTGNLRDDSLDFCVEPDDRKLMKLSPCLRNSVCFIRNNSIESGRVVRIYKNGQPFDRPLRVCITRGLFANLNSLLDHINSRQLVPLGARYLFHLDGQLVYSVHELKHGSIYVVSGTRSFDHRANSIIKQRQKLEMTSKSKGSRTMQVSSPAKPPERSSGQIASSNRYHSPGGAFEQRARQAQVAEKSLERSQTTSSIKSSGVKRTPRPIPTVTPLQQDSSTSRSSENLQQESFAEQPTKITRAKSELSALPSKRKKNVTFVDTGRGSSPFKQLSDEQIQTGPELEQQESELASALKASSTSEIGIQVSDSIDGFLIDLPLPLPSTTEEISSNEALSAKIRGRKVPTIQKARERSIGAKKKRQIVTITERQLSQDELSHFKDLDHGDHHSEKHKVAAVTIRLDTLEVETDKDGEVEAHVSSPDLENTIVLGQDPGDSDPMVEKPNGGQSPKSFEDIDSLRWQYPGGRERSATPTERPVSQSRPNANVRARVTTPSPSISTAGDSNSISMSFEADSELGRAPRQRPPVLGQPVQGLNMPTSNFRLAWVNGFNINHLFPENSTLDLTTSNHQQGETVEHLSPAPLSPARQSSQFKPSERFHNWIFLSRVHDELIFPAGCLLVLWSRTTGEQRYYARHTASVTALTLDSVDTKLAASAQMAPIDDKLGPSIHLWDVSSLETLKVFEDEQFRGRSIFSLRLRNNSSAGCELAVAAKADKRLWLFLLNTRLEEQNNRDIKPSSSPRRQSKTSELTIRANKLLQINQVPLLLARLGTVPPISGSTGNQVDANTDQLVLSFGRRHFQLWSIDTRLHRLVPLQPASRSVDFVSAMTKATCLVKLGPSELLIGDAQGRVNLLQVKVRSSTSSKILSGLARQTVDQYSLECFNLTDSAKATAAITCLARVSGNLFVSADSTCALRFWRIERSSTGTREESNRINSTLLGSLSLPTDLGFVCTILPYTYIRKQMKLDFYVVSTSNVIMFGSVQLQSNLDASASSNLCVVYEGHETSAMNVVSVGSSHDCADQYFTCSFDCKICKWDKSRLVWKSMLPSACAALSVHPIGSVLAAGSADGTVYILDKVSGLLVSYFPLTPVCINCLAYSRDGTLLAAGCANGSIFILPVYDNGLKYKKVSIFQSPHPVVSVQFSLDNKYILTSVTASSYQQLILWDLPNFRYMRENVKSAADQIDWFDSVCSGSEDVRAIWENANLIIGNYSPIKKGIQSGMAVVNLSCHRLMGRTQGQNYVISSDTRGYLRLFSYPCNEPRQGFFELRLSSSPVNCCRFLTASEKQSESGGVSFVSLSLDGSICQWSIE